jgi:hypothetical protein
VRDGAVVGICTIYLYMYNIPAVGNKCVRVVGICTITLSVINDVIQSLNFDFLFQ